MRGLSVLAALCIAGGPALAQDALLHGLDLERQGRVQEAISAFREVLARDPANAAALLGAERLYVQLGRRDSVLALVRRALAVDSTSVMARVIEVRTARAVEGDAAATEALARWIAATPRSVAPYREAARFLINANRAADARAVVESARVRLGSRVELGPELAQIEAAEGDWDRAAAEWRDAVAASPELERMAGFNLRAAPAPLRERILRLLEPDTAASPRRLAADLLLSWGQGERAWTALRGALPDEPAERRETLERFAQRARAAVEPDSRRIAALAFEQLALGVESADAARYRVEAARAYAAAGDAAAARRVLRELAEDPNAPPDEAASTTVALIELLARERRMDEALRLLEQQRARLPGDEVARLTVTIAHGWIVQGRFDRAAATVAADPSLAADEIRGWVALYGGDLARARALLGSSGAVGRQEQRTVALARVVALLQAVEVDTLPALGAALAMAARGDTIRAARELAQLGGESGRHGRAELLAFAADLVAERDRALAEALWTEIADRLPDSAPAPAANLLLARTLAARGEVSLAVRRLEAMILAYPESALVPEARRELDRVRNLVPRS